MQPDENQPTSFADNWPSVLNRMLIGIGVLALGFLVVDKALDSFKSEDGSAIKNSAIAEAPSEDSRLEVVEVVTENIETDADSTLKEEKLITPTVIVERPQVVEVVVPEQEQTSTKSDELVKDQDSFIVTTVADNGDAQESVLEQLTHVFGSAVVIVSAIEPAYVETENERRFLVGSILKNDRILSSISTAQLVVSRVGERRVFELPDMSAQ